MNHSEGYFYLLDEKEAHLDSPGSPVVQVAFQCDGSNPNSNQVDVKSRLQPSEDVTDSAFPISVNNNTNAKKP